MLNKRYKVDAKTLSDLYWDKGLSLLDIGKYLGLASRTVNIRMHELNIPLREAGVPKVNIEKGRLKQLYVDKKFSSRKIAKIYKCAYSTVDRKIREIGFPSKTLAAAHIITKRVTFNGSLTDKAYLIGFRIGDLRVRKMYKNSETILIDCASTHQAQIDLITTLFSEYGRVWIGKPTKEKKDANRMWSRSIIFVFN